MKDKLKKLRSFLSKEEKTAVQSDKKPYSSPALKSYGSVGALTQAGNSSGSDKNSKLQGASDRRIKENIIRIGTHPLNIGLYLFDYKPEFRDAWGHGRQFGVMADEAETVMPEAVSVHPDGYKIIDYAMLGISRSLH